MPLSENLAKTLEAIEALAYLVTREGQLLLESCFRGHSPERISNSISIAKSIVGMVLSSAVTDCKFSSPEDLVSSLLLASAGS